MIEGNNENETNNLNNNNFELPSEFVGRLIVNKIISNAIRDTWVKKVDENFSPFCFDFIKNTVDNFLSQQYACFETDDSDKNINLQEIPLFFDQHHEEFNTWEEIPEPQVGEFDRNCPALIRTSFNNDIKELGFDETEMSFQKTKKASTLSVLAKLSTQSLKDSTQGLVGLGAKKKKEKVPMPELPSYDIPIVLYQRKESDEILKLREEKEEQIRQEELERKRIEAELAKIKEEEEKKNQKISKFDPKKLTFDVEGNIIEKKPLKLNQLAKEFYWSKMHVNLIDQGRKDAKRVTIERGKQKRKTKKNATVKEEVIHNPDNPELGAFFTVRDDKDDKQQREPIIPAGSSFDKMLPQIGVRITENKKVKGGDKDFDKGFNKTSMQQYDKILNEFIPKKNKEMHTFLFTDNSVEQQSQNPLLGDVSQNEATSPSNIHHTNNNNESAMIPNSALGLSMQYSSLMNKLSMSNELDQSIKMNSKLNLSSNLKLTLNSLQDLSDYNMDSQPLSVSRNRNVLFKETSRLLLTEKNRPSASLKDINEFNKKIINSQNTWGRNETFEKAPVSISPTRNKRRTYLTELGYNIVNIKLPRSRRYHRVIDTNSAVKLFKV